MKCQFCSTKNKRSAKFCSSCGKEVLLKTSRKGKLFLGIGLILGLIYLFGGNLISVLLLIPIGFLWYGRWYKLTNFKSSSRVLISILLIFCTFFFIESSPAEPVEQEMIPLTEIETVNITNSTYHLEVLENRIVKSNYSGNATIKPEEISDNSSLNTLEPMESNKSCVSKFLEKTKCQGNDAIFKEIQKTNCDISWAFYKPCSNGCMDGECIEISG